MYKNIDIKMNDMTFELHNVDISVVNAIRRVILSELECIAIENVNYTINTGIINNDIILQRLQLIPFKNYNINKIGYNNIEIIFKQLNEENYIKTYYSKDLIFKNIKTGNLIKHSDLLVYDNIPLLILKPNHKIEFTAEFGIGNTYTGGNKFCPVSVCYYTYMRNKKLINDIITELKKLNTFADKVLETEDNMDAIEDLRKSYINFKYKSQSKHIDKMLDELNIIYNEYDSNDDADLYDFSRKMGLKVKEISINSFYNSEADRIYYNNIFQFTIESNGLYNVKDLPNMAIDLLYKKLDSIQNDILSDVIIIEKNKQIGYNIKIINEDDTIGNLISSHIYKSERYSGYYKPHELDNIIVFTIDMPTEKEVKNVFIDGIDDLKKKLTKLKIK